MIKIMKPELSIEKKRFQSAYKVSKESIIFLKDNKSIDRYRNELVHAFVMTGKYSELTNCLVISIMIKIFMVILRFQT